MEHNSKRAEKGFSSNASNSKGRDQSFQKLKENEFRKLLRPMKTVDCIQSATQSKQGVYINHLNIQDLIDGPIIENELFKTFESQSSAECKPKKSKSDQKSMASKSRTKLVDTKSHNDFILQEKCMNSVK